MFGIRREIAKMTLTETLLANGFTHQPDAHGRKAIYCGRKRVFIGTAPEVWSWLNMLAVMARA